MSLVVLNPGLQSSVQDLGRTGFRHFGVPVSGAFDTHAHELGNHLLGNPPGCASIEMTLIGGAFYFNQTVRACLCGARAPDAVVDDGAGAMPVPHQQVFTVHAKSVLRVGALREGARTYLCVSGGIETPLLLGSRSALVSIPDAGLGCALKKGDEIPIGVATQVREIPVRVASSAMRKNVIRIVPSHHTDSFSIDQIDHIGRAAYRVDSKSNRAGIRLDGGSLCGSIPGRIESVATLPGYVQVPPDGNPIVLGVDGPTTGGYPVIACVIERDVSRLGQLSPNDRVEFEWITHEQARALYEDEP
jgi:biotin-dependent carboxylase-like uncharacterized protein